MFSGKEDDLATRQHDFNGTSSEVNKVRQSLYLGRHSQQTFAKICLQEAQEINAVRSRS